MRFQVHWDDDALADLAEAVAWSVPPLGVLYNVVNAQIRVARIVDVRRLLQAP